MSTALETRKNVEAMNKVQRPAGFVTESARLKIGELNCTALELVELGFKRDRERELQDRALVAAAGLEETTELTSQAQKEKQERREKLTRFARKALNPDRLLPQICAGVAKRKISPNDGLWLAQKVSNAVCTLAVQESVRLRRQAGQVTGVVFSKDDAEVFDGLEARDLEVPARDNRFVDNPFGECDDPSVVQAEFESWFDANETQLIALSGASADRDGNPMPYGHHSRWEETSNGWVQIVESFEQRLATALDVRNSQPDVNDDTDKNAWDSF